MQATMSRPRRTPKIESRELDVSRLCEDVNRCGLILRRPRQERMEAVLQYVGNHYSDEGTSEKVPINLIALYVSIVSRSLISRNPRVMLSTFQAQSKPTVSAMQVWANKKMDDMNMASTLQRVVIDALFSIGICKTALATPSDAATEGWGLKAGQPYVCPVDLDDFRVDMHAKRWDEIQWIGHRYRVPLDTVRDDSSLYSSARKDLTASENPIYNPEGDERISVIGRTTYSTNSSEFEDMVELCEIYLPRRRLVITVAWEDVQGAMSSSGNSRGRSIDALRVQRWLGSEDGPFTILGYHVVPGNLMPKAPIQDLMDLHNTANNLYRKIIRQADRLKSVLAAGGGATEDAARIQAASDGDIIQVNNVERIKPFICDDINRNLLAVFMDCMQRFSYMAGNLDMMGGLSPQSKTAKQDEMLQQNASGTVASMQDTTFTFVSQVIKNLLWYYHHDPFETQESAFSVPGLPEASVVRSVTPQQRQQIPWKKLDVKVDPYSLTHQTPQTRWAAIQQFLQQTVMPVLPMAQQQGIMLDLNKLFQKGAEYLDQPDLPEILTVGEPPQQQPGGGQSEQPGMPQNTHRSYERISNPGRTQKGTELNNISAMMGVDSGGASGQEQPMGAQ